MVLGRWERTFFDDMWYSAKDCNKPTVTPMFVLDSYEKGKLMDPTDYSTRGPQNLRKDGPKKAKSRPTVGGRKKRGRCRGEASSQLQSVPERTFPYPTLQPPISRRAAPKPTVLQQSVFPPTVLQPTTPPPVVPHQETPLPQQATAQPVILQHRTTPHENQLPLPPCEKAPELGHLVKTELLDDNHLDFAFAIEVLLSWNPNEENGAALWKRMETMVRSLAVFLGLLVINVQFQRSCATASSWEEFCEEHWSWFERFLDIYNESTRA